MSESINTPDGRQDAKLLARSEILFEDDRTRITCWRFAPGAETGWHYHAVDYVTIQQSGGRLRLEKDDGSVTFVDYKDQRTIAYQAPIKHNATNVSDEEVRVTEIELKR